MSIRLALWSGRHVYIYKTRIFFMPLEHSSPGHGSLGMWRWSQIHVRTEIGVAYQRTEAMRETEKRARDWR